MSENTRTCLECEQVIQVRADGTFVMHAYPGFPVECAGSENAAYAPEPAGTTAGRVEIAHVRDAEIRVYNREPGTDDASDMYVLEVLGVTVLVRLVTNEESGTLARTEPKIMIEAGGQFAVGVNDDVNYYGDGS